MMTIKTQKTVLILSCQQDTTARHLMERLSARRIPHVRLDTGDFPSRVTLNATFINQHWQGTITMEGDPYDLNAFSSIWYRRPSHYKINTALPETVQEFAEREATRGFGGILRSLPCLWVSHPDALKAANYKPHQLAVAASLGFHTPATLITNNPHAVQDFYQQHAGNIIYKTLSAGFIAAGGDEYDAIYTSKVCPQHLEEIARVRLTAHLFQHYIAKAFEIRITVIGPHVFAVAIDAPRELTDWRAHYQELTYRVYYLPAHIELQCLQLTRHFGLMYSTIDMIVTPQDEHYFLEINPAGQYLWLEAPTGLPLTDTLIDVLTQVEGKGLSI